MSAMVLVVEDTPANMKLASMLLRKAGYEVLQATTAEDGIMLAREYQPQLVLMDIHLPGMDGIRAARELKADPSTAAIPVVALTALAMVGDEERIRAAGCQGYITKPIRYREFLEEVARQLALAQGPPP